MRVFVLLLIMVSVSCVKKNEVKFSLDGKTSAVVNGTVIYLIDETKDKIIDSVSIVNNIFNFSTTLKQTPLRVILKTKNGSLYKRFWAENKPMKFNAIKTDFRNANIQGSNSETIIHNLDIAFDSLSRTQYKKLLLEFVANNIDNILGACVLSESYIGWGKETTEPLYKQFSEANKNSHYGKKIAKYIALNKNPKVKDQFVDFELNDQNGNKVKLSDFKDKTILLEFWASWCVPCRKDNKNLVKTYDKFKSKGFEIVSVSLDNKREEWINAIKNDSLTWANVSNLKGWESEAGLIYGIKLLPTNFLIDTTGVIIDEDLRGEKLDNKLEELLLGTNSISN